jgi:hypothetical protein
VLGGLGGPGAMKTTVVAVELLATTGSLTSINSSLIFFKFLTLQMPGQVIEIIKNPAGRIGGSQ